MINEILVFAKQILALLQYDGPVTQSGAQMRNTPQGSVLRGLMTNISSSGIDYIEKNRNKLGK